MIFKCKNCGGYTVYSPKYKQMYCPFCDSKDSHEQTGNRSLTNCPSCGGEIKIGQFTSSDRCPYCNNYLIFDERIENEYLPDTIIPFEFDEEEARKVIEEAYKKYPFIPSSFLSEKKLQEVKGNYVPFFLYDYKGDIKYQGTGTTTKSWRSGNYRYTETSYFDVTREFNAYYDDVPADASTEKPDSIMDLMEPYDYSKRIKFEPKYLSGFYGEIFNKPANEYQPRALQKAIESVKTLLTGSLNAYQTLNPSVNSFNPALKLSEIRYALFPVYSYSFKWGGKTYDIFVNGQTKKVVGEPPVSKKKLLLYSLSSGGFLFAIIEMLMYIWEAW